jgi:hypothetical protein
MKRMDLTGAAAAVAMAAMASACGGNEGGSGSGTGPAPGLSYYKDIKPILDAKCTQCHYEGGIGPFSLQAYDAAQPWGPAIKQQVVDKIMPPWPPDKACNDYVGDTSLSEEQIQKIAGWVDAGMPKGKPSEEGAPLDTGPDMGLSRVDVSLSMPLEYTPQSEPDDYRCFVIDWPETTVKYVSGFRATPSEPRVVHHVIGFVAGPSQLAQVTALDDADPAEGYPCFGTPGFIPTQLGSWAPGRGADSYAEGTGIKVEPGSKVIIQVHYNTLVAGKLPDRTTIDLKLESTVAKEGRIQLVTNFAWVGGQAMEIPAFEPDVVHSFTLDPTQAFTGGNPFRIYKVAVHMHTLGTRGRLWIERAGGATECLLDIPHWNFHWQGAYTPTETIDVQPGDKMGIECHFDNSPANQPIVGGQQQVPKNVYWGEGTTDEMCLGGYYTTDI